jgi:Transposase DDE domain
LRLNKAKNLWLSSPQEDSTTELLKKIFDFIQNNPVSHKYYKSTTDFTREYKQTFSSVVFVILNLFKESLDYNLLTILPQISDKQVKASAFSTARYKIKEDFFIDLNKLIFNHISTNKPKLWKGFKLIAGDGTTVSLPASPSIKAHFGVNTVSKAEINKCQANSCMLYDVLSNFVIDADIQPSSVGEVSILHKMINRTALDNSILLLDRGFGNFAMCKKLVNKKVDFCIRLSKVTSNFARKALVNTSSDFITDWEPSYSSKKTCKFYDLDTNSIKVRVTKVTLKTGEIEILVSSFFDQQAITQGDMKELYGLRWGIEEGFKKLKPKMKLESFGCRKHQGIYQEFYAHIIMMNIVSLIAENTEEKIEEITKGRKIKYKYNWQTAFKLIRLKFVDIFFKGEFLSTLKWLIEKIAASIIAIKPGRNFKRDKTAKLKKRVTQCYK